MNPRSSGLQTDLYEITMAAAYHARRREESATFELFVRSLPSTRDYLLVAGLAPVVDFLRRWGFGEDDLRFLREQEILRSVGDSFFEHLRGLQFSGELWAMPEGTIAFAHEPLLRVTAPIIEAQLLETFLLATVTFQTMIATKAARIVTVAAGRPIIEFGTRRAHGFEAGTLAARAAYLAGCAGTSNVEAGRRYGIPVQGTLAHSFVMAFPTERDAFVAFTDAFPDRPTLLVDTYDSLDAVRLVARDFGNHAGAIRLDSGDLGELSREARRILDEAGFNDIKIYASGDLNESRIAQLVHEEAPIDAFGVGTDLVTSADAPSLGGVYKLVDIRQGTQVSGRVKLSPEKELYPHAKQVWRLVDAAGRWGGDLIALADEEAPDLAAQPLLQPVMREGELVSPLPTLGEDRARARASLHGWRQRVRAGAYPVAFSQKLQAARERAEEIIRKERQA